MLSILFAWLRHLLIAVVVVVDDVTASKNPAQRHQSGNKIPAKIFGISFICLPCNWNTCAFFGIRRDEHVAKNRKKKWSKWFRWNFSEWMRRFFFMCEEKRKNVDLFRNICTTATFSYNGISTHQKMHRKKNTNSFTQYRYMTYHITKLRVNELVKRIKHFYSQFCMTDDAINKLDSTQTDESKAM